MTTEKDSVLTRRHAPSGEHAPAVIEETRGTQCFVVDPELAPDSECFILDPEDNTFPLFNPDDEDHMDDHLYNTEEEIQREHEFTDRSLLTGCGVTALAMITYFGIVAIRLYFMY